MLLASSALLVLGLMLLSSAHSPVVLASPVDLFVTPGGSGTTCSQDIPCALQTAIGEAVGGDTIYVAQGTYTGSGDAVITVTASITLYGGWDGAPSGLIVRDPVLYPSTLDGERARRVVHISGNITPTLDGFIITRGNATGLLVNCPSNPDGCGGGIFVNSAHPIIAHNTITDNIAAITTSGSPTASGYGGGLYMVNAMRAVINSNVVISNAASTANYGAGGGIYMWGSAEGVQVRSNQVLSNSATTANSFGRGGGIYGGPDGALIEGNSIENNQANGAGTGMGSGLFQYGGTAQYVGNLVRGNKGAYAVALQYSRAYLEGNRVVDNDTGEGITLQSASGGGPTLVNNIIGRSGGRTLSIYGFNAASVMTVTLFHNTLVGSGTGTGVYGQYANVYMTNTIVVGYGLGITNTTPLSSTVMPDYTLFWTNASDGIRGSNPVDGDPDFIDPASADFHLGPGSMAFNSGIATWVTTDIDGDARPMGMGYDIGADERIAVLYRSLLPLITKP
jgi:hypothetical protein